MEVLNMLNELEEMIESSKSLFGNKATIDKTRALEIITDIRISLPDDFKQAEWISQERQRIIYDAEDDAKEIREKATLEAEQMVEQDNITKKAYERAKDIIRRAEEDATELRNGAIFYSQDIMKKIAKDMTSIAERVMLNYDELDQMVIKTDDEEKESEEQDEE
ncbi:MAG: ATPase [Peptostreptococcaceae bacterium]|nr:ATPase [Peptostreptococcaceae bacterium]